MNSVFKPFASRRIAVVLLLGFSSGLPLLLTADTLQAWMVDLKYDLGVIGFFSLATLPYSLKLLWAPLVDRYVPPFMGRRRGWILIAQVSLVLSLVMLALSPDPFIYPRTLFFMALLVAFFSASQDIVVDAYRAEVLRKEELGPGASCGVLGYQLALLVCGGLALVLSDHLPVESIYLRWRLVYLLMAAILASCIITTIFAPEPELDARPPRTFKEAVVLPFLQFFTTKGALEIFLFILLYKLAMVVAQGLTTPFLRQLGFTNTDVGAVNKGLGLVAMLCGTLLGGALVARLKIYRSLLIFGILQALGILPLAWLAHLGHDYRMMVAGIMTISFFSGMGTAAYVAFLMSLCDKRFTATQYAFFTSLVALSRTVTRSPSGYLSEMVGWESFFLISALLAVPGLVLLWLRYDRWETI